MSIKANQLRRIARNVLIERVLLAPPLCHTLLCFCNFI